MTASTRLCALHARVRPEECLVFEDSRSGVRSGVAAGVLGVVGIRSCLPDEDLRACGCATTIADWSEFTNEVLDQLQQNGRRTVDSSPEPAA